MFGVPELVQEAGVGIREALRRQAQIPSQQAEARTTNRAA